MDSQVIHHLKGFSYNSALWILDRPAVDIQNAAFITSLLGFHWKSYMRVR